MKNVLQFCTSYLSLKRKSHLLYILSYFFLIKNKLLITYALLFCQYLQQQKNTFNQKKLFVTINYYLTRKKKYKMCQSICKCFFVNYFLNLLILFANFRCQAYRNFK